MITDLTEKGDPMDNISYIGIIFGGMCEGCGQADLDLDCAELLGERYWSIRCNHERACIAARQKALSEAERRTGEA